MAEDIFEKVSKKIESYENEMVDCACKLVAMPAITPHEGGEGEAKKAAYVEGMLKG